MIVAPLVAATPFHAEALALIHASAFPPAARWDAAAFATQLSLPGTFGFIADAAGMVLARTAADEAEILTLAVHPTARRAGVARALMQAAINTATAAGATTMFLEVSLSNQSAMALYTGFGFAEVGRRPNYYGPGEAALVLRRGLCGK